MGNTYTDKPNHDKNEGDIFHTSDKSGQLTGSGDLYISDSKSWNLVKCAKPRTLILDLIQSETGQLLLKRSCGLGITVPKDLICLDEKYLRRCLELIHTNASKGAPCALYVNPNFSDMGFTPKIATVARRNSLDGANNALDYPMDIGEGIVGSIMESSSMMSILENPVFERLGPGGSSLFEDKRCIPLDYRGSPCPLTLGQSEKPRKNTFSFRNREYGSSSSPDLQGMLQCTWQGGIPCFGFSLDDRKNIYVANARKAEVVDNDKALDYVYSFHSKPSGIKTRDLSDNESDLIGKMKVSTSFSLCANNSKVTETKFVVVGANENHTSAQKITQSRKLSKVIDMFKSGHSLKQKPLSLFDDFSSEIDFTTNLEMASIIVKDHTQNVQSENEIEEVGGWGLKFLKNKQNTISTSMDIIVPQGHHGGLKNEPSSLIERWRSGGQCDCGGWDIGCPLKVLKAMPCSESESSCKSFDVFSEGSEQERPTLKLVNIHEGLYFMSFNSCSLSPLQCFSIAVALIHSQSPCLRPKHVHGCMLTEENTINLL